jgi:hypothetical protein
MGLVDCALNAFAAGVRRAGARKTSASADHRGRDAGIGEFLAKVANGGIGRPPRLYANLDTLEPARMQGR